MTLNFQSIQYQIMKSKNKFIKKEKKSYTRQQAHGFSKF